MPSMLRIAIFLIFLELSSQLSNAFEDASHVINAYGEVKDITTNEILYSPVLHKIKEDLSLQKDFSSDDTSSHRKRRSIDGFGVQGLSASQNCEGIALEWLPLELPYSSDYDLLNHSEFRHYNIYRSNARFDDVSGMIPHASGLTDLALGRMDTTMWVDRYPSVMIEWFYAVTFVDGRGQEEKSVTAVKAKAVGAIEKLSKPFVMIPAVLRGRVMRQSLAYNDKRNEYLIAFDWDANYDGVADHMYVLRMNQDARVVDKTTLNITAQLPGWIGGDQGSPAAAYNPSRDEYLVIWHLRSKRHFNNRYVIIGQRLFASKTQRAASPTVIAKFDKSIDAKQPKLLYNSKTGGYVVSLVAQKPKSDIVSLFLSHESRLLTSKSVCSFKTSSYEHNLFYDSVRDEIYFTCSLEKRGANADFKLKDKQFVILMTKMDAIGGHAANTDETSKTLLGYSSKRYTRHDGYYNKNTDRLVLFWEDVKNRKNTISSTSVIMTRLFFIRKSEKYTCPIKSEVKSPVALPLATSGGHFLIWQEKHRFSWNIGGYLMKGNFRLTKGVQKNPVVVYNSVRKAGFVVWQESFRREIRLIGRHFVESSSHSCSPLCSANQKCVLENTCVSRNPDLCATNNGDCSHTCSKIPRGRRLCSCPKHMKLQEDGTTCQDIPPCQGLSPVKDPLTSKDLFCGRGPLSVDCPADSYCHIHPSDTFAKCCPDLLAEYSMFIASQGVIWKLTENQKLHKSAVERMPLTQGLSIVAIGYDPQDKRIYWSDVNQGVIKRAFMDGSGEENIVSFAKVPDGLYIDVKARKIYWTDTGFDRIEKANLDGSAKKIIVDSGLDQPRAIVIHKKRSLLYWTDWGSTAKIERATLDGGQRKTIINGGLFWPNGLIIDEERSRLYWADAKLRKIETSDLEGRNRRLLVDESFVKHPFSLVILKNRLFWTDWGTGSVQSVDKYTGKDFRQSFTGFMQPKGLFVFFTNARHEQKCKDPGIPDNGGRHPAPDPSGHYATGNMIILTCRPGYTIIGPTKRTCQKSGKWNKKATFCKAPPVLTALPVNETIDEGDSLVLKCSASAGGKPIKVQWKKNKFPLIPSKKGEYFVGRNGNLVFLTVYFEDRGLYECIAQNEAGTVTAIAHVRVRAKIKHVRDCGRPRYKTRARIIGGRRADRGAHPWQVMLWNKHKKNHFCGGTLISDRWVVTAAHCLSKIKLFPSDIILRVGKHVRTRKEKNEQSIEADAIIIHPNFKMSTYDSDIALIRASKSVIFTDYIQPICLPSSKSDYALLTVNKTGLISGWGSRKYGRDPARRLHETMVPVVSQPACIASHQPKYIVTANMFCAGQKNSSLGDACQGDSGGPFSINNPEKATPFVTRHVLMGVVSWGDGCGRYGKYGVYTRLTNYMDWLMREIIKM